MKKQQYRIMTARWVDDVFPHDIAEGQRYWDLVHASFRMKAAGLSRDQIHERCGILPREYSYVAQEPESPLIKYFESEIDLWSLRRIMLDWLAVIYRDQIEDAVNPGRKALQFWRE